MTKHWLLIKEISARLGAKDSAVEKWKQRRVPYRYRLPIMREAALLGIILTESDFETREVS